MGDMTNQPGQQQLTRHTPVLQDAAQVVGIQHTAARAGQPIDWQQVLDGAQAAERAACALRRQAQRQLAAQS